MTPSEPVSDQVIIAANTRAKDNINPAKEFDLDAPPGDPGFENILNFRDVGLTINKRCGAR
jgi:hypothetical protein